MDIFFTTHSFILTSKNKCFTGIKDYPEAEKPAALFVTYYRKNLTPYAGDGRGLSGVVPNYFMGYSLIEIPEDHPEDGSPQGMSCSKNVFSSLRM